VGPPGGVMTAEMSVMTMAIVHPITEMAIVMLLEVEDVMIMNMDATHLQLGDLNPLLLMMIIQGEAILIAIIMGLLLLVEDRPLLMILTGTLMATEDMVQVPIRLRGLVHDRAQGLQDMLPTEIKVLMVLVIDLLLVVEVLHAVQGFMEEVARHLLLAAAPLDEIQLRLLTRLVRPIRLHRCFHLPHYPCSQ